MSECSHMVIGYHATRYIWVGGIFYAVCKLCGKDVRRLVDPAINKMN